MVCFIACLFAESKSATVGVCVCMLLFTVSLCHPICATFGLHPRVVKTEREGILAL